MDKSYYFIYEDDSKTYQKFMGLELKIQTPHKEMTNIKYISEGTFNVVYKATNWKNKEVAVRMTRDSLITEEEDLIDDAYNEAVLTLNMAELNITPKVRDIFFARTKDGDIKLFVVSDLAKKGTVKDFLLSPSFDGMNKDEIKKMVDDIVDLYKRMIENDVFCIDIKFENMLVAETVGQKKFTVIDFDTGFCSASNSLITFEKLKNRILKNKICDKKDKNDKCLKEILLYINILQLCFPVWVLIEKKSKKIELFYKYLIQKIPVEKLDDMIDVLNTSVGSGDHSISSIMKHYVSWYFQMIGMKDLKDDAMVYALYMLALFGHDNFNIVRRKIALGIPIEPGIGRLFGWIFPAK